MSAPWREKKTKKKTSQLSNLPFSGRQEIWTQRSLMWQEVKIPRREHQLLHFHGNGNESSLPYCLGHLLYEITVGEHTVIFGPVFKVHGGKRELKQIWSLRGEPAGQSSPPASEECGRLPYDSLCNADSSLIYVFFLPPPPLAPPVQNVD